MNLTWQISIIDGLIMEDPESTIKDYIILMSELEAIKPPQTEDMNKPLLYTADDAEFIIKHYREYTVRQIAANLGLDESVVRNFGSRHRLEFKRQPLDRSVVIAPADKVTGSEIDRPAANYSNTGFISVTQKYAS